MIDRETIDRLFDRHFVVPPRFDTLAFLSERGVEPTAVIRQGLLIAATAPSSDKDEGVAAVFVQGVMFGMVLAEERATREGGQR